MSTLDYLKVENNSPIAGSIVPVQSSSNDTNFIILTKDLIDEFYDTMGLFRDNGSKAADSTFISDVEFFRRLNPYEKGKDVSIAVNELYNSSESNPDRLPAIQTIIANTILSIVKPVSTNDISNYFELQNYQSNGNTPLSTPTSSPLRGIDANEDNLSDLTDCSTFPYNLETNQLKILKNGISHFKKTPIRHIRNSYEEFFRCISRYELNQLSFKVLITNFKTLSDPNVMIIYNAIKNARNETIKAELMGKYTQFKDQVSTNEFKLSSLNCSEDLPIHNKTVQQSGLQEPSSKTHSKYRIFSVLAFPAAFFAASCLKGNK